MVASLEPIEYNPFLPEVHEDPYPVYRRLREEAPVHWNVPGIWLLTRYADAVHLLRHPRMGSDFRASDLFELFVQMSGDAWAPEREPSMLFRDPPDHTRLRNLVSRAFTARVIEELGPFMREVVAGLLDVAAERGEFDVVTGLAHPLPVAVICRMLGVPAEDEALFAGWSEDLVHTLDPMVPLEVMRRGNEATEAFEAYFRDLIAERRRRPGEDLLTALIAAEEAGDRLSEQELLTTLILLLVAGHETTVNLIGNGTLALLRNPVQLQRLRDDPSLIRTGVEELLRYDSPVQFTGRVALGDVEFGDVKVGKGQQVVALLGAANRDPAQFLDPDRLDVGREDNRHIAFGGGIHFCLGAALARAEGRVAIAEVVTRFPGLELAGEPERKTTITLRGLRHLPVAA
jgi:cytochrome P450